MNLQSSSRKPEADANKCPICGMKLASEPPELNRRNLLSAL